MQAVGVEKEFLIFMDMMRAFYDMTWACSNLEFSIDDIDVRLVERYIRKYKK